MFKQLAIFRPTEGCAIPNAEAIEAALQPMRYLPIGPTQEKSVSFYPPRGSEHGPLVEALCGQYIMRAHIETKSVPGSVVREKTEEICKRLESETGRKPGKKERRDIMDDVHQTLLPAAFPRMIAVTIWIDPERRTLCLDTASQGKCDDVLSALIGALGELSVCIIQTVASPQAAMTKWLLAETPYDWPSDMTVERETVLKSTGEDGATVKFTKHYLATDEVKKHVMEGKMPTQLGMSWDGRVAFVLTETLRLKKVQFLDGVMDESGTDKLEDRFDADVALSTGLLRALLDSLIQALGGEVALA